MQVSVCVAALQEKEARNEKQGGAQRRYKKLSQTRRERSNCGKEPGLHLTTTRSE